MKFRNGQEITTIQAIGYWFLDNWVRFLVSFLIISACVVTYCAVNGGWTELIAYSNGLFIGGASAVLISALSVCSMFGAFDFVSYFAFRKRKENGVEDYYEYSSRKRNEKMRNKLSFLPYLVFGLMSLLASIIINAVLFQ